MDDIEQEAYDAETAFMRRLKEMTLPEMRRALLSLVQTATTVGNESLLYLSEFSPSEIRTLERVIQECAGQSGSELSRRTHLEGPWLLVWNAHNPNQPIRRVLFRWLDNLPDEADHASARQSLSRDSVQREIAELAA